MLSTLLLAFDAGLLSSQDNRLNTALLSKSPKKQDYNLTKALTFFAIVHVLQHNLNFDHFTLLFSTGFKLHKNFSNTKLTKAQTVLFTLRWSS